MAKITLLGMENYLNPNNKSVFDNLTLPPDIDKETVIDTILLRAGEMEVLYPNPEFMTACVNIWGRKHYRTFDKWAKALKLEYNPIENYDRYEDITDNHEGNMNSSGSSSSKSDSTMTNDLKDTTDNTTVHSKKAYNDTDYVSFEKEKIDSEDKHTGTSKNAGSSNDSFSNKNDEKATDKHTGHIHGNIGVTTSQMMLQSELDLARWNIYEKISDLFVSEFLIQIY